MTDNLLDTQPIRRPTIPKDATVLVVEDNVANFVLIARMLGYLGIHCEWKTSGYEVVEYADTLPRLDLILEPWLLVAVLGVMILLCVSATSLALLRLRKLEPAMVFRV